MGDVQNKHVYPLAQASRDSQPCEGHEDHQVWQLFSEELSPPWRCVGFRSHTHAGVTCSGMAPAQIQNAPGPPWATGVAFWYGWYEMPRACNGLQLVWLDT